MSTLSPPALVGADLQVPLVGGGTASYINLDFAASAPALVAVRDAVEAFLPWYSSVHRGAGWKSQVSTLAYEHARSDVAAFVGARDDDVAIFTRNTTDAINVLSAAVPSGGTVVTFEGEHHANLLPWRHHRFVHIPLPDDPSGLVPALDAVLRDRPAGDVLVAVTAVSNVTGELWPIADLAACAHRHGARIAVDCAQLAPHAPVTMGVWDADWVVLSGHKMYAPYGAGALVGRCDWLERGEPFLRGGGAVAFVTHEEVVWGELPDRQEAGSPNVIGAVAMAAAARELTAYGMDRVLEHEIVLERRANELLTAIPGLTRYRAWGAQHPGIAVLSFNLDGMHHSLVASALSAEHAIAVRDGCFCAHPLMLRLLDVPDAQAEVIRQAILGGDRSQVPGAVRASAGLTTTEDDLERLADALGQLVTDGPLWTYERDPASGYWTPNPDDRSLPSLPGFPSTG